MPSSFSMSRFWLGSHPSVKPPPRFAADLQLPTLVRPMLPPITPPPCRLISKRCVIQFCDDFAAVCCGAAAIGFPGFEALSALAISEMLESLCANALMLNSTNIAIAMTVNFLTRCDMDPPGIFLRWGPRLNWRFTTLSGIAASLEGFYLGVKQKITLNPLA